MANVYVSSPLYYTYFRVQTVLFMSSFFVSPCRYPKCSSTALKTCRTLLPYLDTAVRDNCVLIQCLV